MPKTINVEIREKIAKQTNRTQYICGNSDFIVNFDFDAEWNEFTVKTARFIYGGQYVDVVFDGNQCALPVISDTYSINVGVFAGNLRTTTPAYISAKKSILCDAGLPAAPTDDVYAQIISMIEGKIPEEYLRAACEEYVAKNFVSYLEQAYTEEAKAQARKNIGAVEKWNDVESKPFGKTAIGDTITWDGETDTRVHEMASVWHRIHDIDERDVLDNIELFKNAVAVESNGSEYGLWHQGDDILAYGKKNGACPVVVALKDGASLPEHWRNPTFAKKGIYFHSPGSNESGTTWPSAFTVPGYTFVDEKMDRFCLPDTVFENGDDHLILKGGSHRYKVTVKVMGASAELQVARIENS